jgi:hypothetical protein
MNGLFSGITTGVLFCIRARCPFHISVETLILLNEIFGFIQYLLESTGQCPNYAMPTSFQISSNSALILLILKNKYIRITN